jgi:hypothetical protein
MRQRGYHVGHFQQGRHCRKVRQTNCRATDEMHLFILKFQQGALNPDSAFLAILAHEAIAFIFLGSSQLYDRVRKFEEPFFRDLTMGQRVPGTYHDRFLFLVKRMGDTCRQVVDRTSQ